LETLSLAPDALVLEGAAVLFDSSGVREGHRFLPFAYGCQTPHAKVLECDVLDYRGVSIETLQWWKQENLASLEELLRAPRAPWSDVWKLLTDLCKDACVWAQGTDFDISVLKYVGSAHGWKMPWRYNRVRDARTIVAVAKTMGWPPPDNTLQKHVAADDAYYQVNALLGAFDFLKMELE
jgi:hypothetical protein